MDKNVSSSLFLSALVTHSSLALSSPYPPAPLARTRVLFPRTALQFLCRYELCVLDLA